MPKAPTLDEIDLGEEKRCIVFAEIVSIWWYLGIAVVGFLSIAAGVTAKIFPFGGRPGEDDSTTMLILGLLIGIGLLFLDVLLFVAMWYLSGERVLVYTKGVCYEWKSLQECYRWKDILKILTYESDPRVYWLYFKSGRKVCMSLIGGIAEKDWIYLRKLLDRKLADKFVEEP